MSAQASDRITLTGLRVRGNHGVHDFERRDGQEFAVDVDLELSTAQAAASDDVADTVDYGTLAQQRWRTGSLRPVWPTTV